MGLVDKIFNKKEDKKPVREVGSNFDKSDAEKIFDALDNIESKPKKDISPNIKKEIDKTQEISGLASEAQKLMMSEKFSEAIAIFKKITVIDPNNSDAYESLADIYNIQNDKNSEIEILRLAVSNLENNSIKSNFIKRLKELDN